MNNIIINAMYYLSVCFSTILITHILNPGLFEAVLIGLAVGVFFTTFIRPIVDLYIGD
jgi:hypothetical protein